jgi:hypothetical protein
MACRPGAYAGSAHFVGVYRLRPVLPMVGAKIFLATNGSLDPKEITNHEVIATRAGCPAGRPLSSVAVFPAQA